jgi:hypothetical protein
MREMQRKKEKRTILMICNRYLRVNFLGFPPTGKTLITPLSTAIMICMYPENQNYLYFLLCLTYTYVNFRHPGSFAECSDA